LQGGGVSKISANRRQDKEKLEVKKKNAKPQCKSLNDIYAKRVRALRMSFLCIMLDYKYSV
jgi:hypothetical protein